LKFSLKNYKTKKYLINLHTLTLQVSKWR